MRQAIRAAKSGDWPQPPETCLALPGTREKAEVMLARVRACTQRCPRGCPGAKSAAHVGYQPCHPDDATWLDFARVVATSKRLLNGSDTPVQLRIDGVPYAWHCSITPIDQELVEKVALKAMEQAQFIRGAERLTPAPRRREKVAAE